MIKVIYPGFYTSVQDEGRFGYRNIGVPISGSMDAVSAGLSNALLNNKKNDAVLEITLMGPKLEFTLPTNIVVTGAEMSAKLNENPILNNKAYPIIIGDVLTFGQLKKGVRSYLALTGGFQTEKVLKSRSFYTGITSRGVLVKNDLMPFKSKPFSKIESKGSVSIKSHFYETNILEVFEGPEFYLFSKEEQEKITNFTYTVSNKNNRMGYRLDEEVLKHTISMITNPVLPGTVQLIPSGQLIILMKDAQTTGGYPRIFQLTELSVAILAQKKAGDKISFKLISNG